MFDKMHRILESVDADYTDIRYEIKRDTVVNFEGRELTRIDKNTTDGFVLRVLKDGGLSSVIFTKEGDADKAIRKALENAHHLAKNVVKPIQLAGADAVDDAYFPVLGEDPRNVSMEEKLEIVKHYNDIPLDCQKVVTTSLGYQELAREKYFLNTEGSRIREDLVTTRLSGEITSKDGSLIQNVRVRAGGSNGFQTIRNQDENMEERTAIALDLLKAKPVQPGVYNIVLNQGLAGVFTHEAFGHFSEADIIETLPAMREKMKIGSKLGGDILNIVDDATMLGQLGHYRYDDEGVRVRRTELMREGVLVGRLHSRRTAAEFGEPLSGHFVAEDYRYSPIVRMGTIFIEPGGRKFEELIKMLGDGLYILDAKGGQTSGENFTFGAQYGYTVKGGKLADMVRDINISGNLYKTLTDIVAVGDDLVFSTAGGCGKGQLNIRSCYGAPHIIAKDLVVGGA